MAVLSTHGKSLTRRVASVVVPALALAMIVGVVATATHNPRAAAETSTVVKDPIVTDAFNRTVKKGWNAAPVGGAYKHSDSKYFSVDGTAGVATLPRSGSAVTASLMSVSSGDTVAAATIIPESIPSKGNGVYAGLQLRSSGTSYYQANVRVDPTGGVSINMLRVNGSTTNQTSLVRDLKVAKGLKAGEKVTLEFQATGTSPVSLSARAWITSAAKPDWQATASDTSASAITRPGAIGVWSYVSSGTPATSVGWQDLSASRITGVTPEPPEPEQPAPGPEPEPPTTDPGDGADTATGTPGVRDAAGAAPIGSTNYPIAGRALYVATNGSDSANGSIATPLDTVKQAVAKASSGDTIVLRGGNYHETVVVPTNKKLTIQSYPGEKAYLDGSRTVGNWQASGSTWVSTGWTAQFDSSPTYFRGKPDNTAVGWAFLNPAYPMAAHPDQVWIDGAALDQVSSLAKVKQGTFYVDYGADRLYIGSNPNGKLVRASDTVKALTVAGAGSTVRGIGIRNYSPSVPDMGAVIIAGNNVTFENVAITDSATSGLAVYGTNVTLRHVTVARSGMLGANASEADGLKVIGMLATDNNVEHFNRAPVSGGLKVHKSRGVTVTDSDFKANLGNSLWFDESVYNMTITGNDITDATGYGLVIELSATATVANNIIANNGMDGLLITDSGQIQVWNNTITGNQRNINITQDTRRASNLAAAGHDKRQKLPDPTVTWITGNITVGNNVLANAKGKCLLCVEDYSHQRSAAQMNIQSDGNIFQRPSKSAPTWAVVWSRGAGNPAVFNTVDDFSGATGRDVNSRALDGSAVLSSLTTLTSAVNAWTSTVARPLPAGVAGLIGQPAGTKHLGAFK